MTSPVAGRVFVDTNVFVYAFDADEPRKRELALGWLETPPDGGLAISTQVLAEFFVTVTRKLQTRLSHADAALAVEELARLPVVDTDAALVQAAIDTSDRHQLSLWDAMIVEAAVTAGCTVLLTEDLAHGAELRGVQVHDPFRRDPT